MPSEKRTYPIHRRQDPARTPRGLLAAAALIFTTLPLPAGAAPATRPPALEVVRSRHPLRIDGRLDEADWSTAAVIDDFTMQLPQDGVPASEKTVVRLLYDEENLYLGITCFDSEPAKIQVSSLVRDSFAVGAAEQIAFAIDSSDSGRDGFWFSSNPGGAQIDAQVFDEGRVFDPEWDGVWESAGRIDPQGWTVEIRLPFFNLRFQEEAANTMRIDFFRAIRHKNEEDYSPAIPRNYTGTMSFSLGRPVVFRGIHRGRRVEIKPAVLVTASSAYPRDGGGAGDSDVAGDAGLDAKWGITSGLTADFTLHPDFAQVEADDQQINLTRFSLFFPEKREFFLENAGLFSFGLPHQTEAFFSRRIGIEDATRSAVPILGGARLTGRAHGWSVGVIEAATEATSFSPETHFAVARVRRDLGKRSTVGAIFMDREGAGEGGGNRLEGVDTHLVLGQDQFVNAFVMASRNTATDSEAGLPRAGGEGSGEDGYAADGRYDRTGDRWRYGASSGFVDEGFRPGIGFVQRGGVQYAGGYVSFRPRPEKLRSVRQFEFTTEGDYLEARVADPLLDGRTLDRTWRFSHQTELQSGDRLAGLYRRHFERVTQDFLIAEREGVVIPAGDYLNTAAELSFSTFGGRRASGFGFFNYGAFFDGRQQSLGGGVTARFSAHLSVDTSATLNRVRLPGGDFARTLWITRVNYGLSPTLFGGALVQWNTETNDLDLNLRLDFIHTPGSDLFVVYNESLNTPREPGESRSNSRAGIVKLTYLFHF